MKKKIEAIETILITISAERNFESANKEMEEIFLELIQNIL